MICVITVYNSENPVYNSLKLRLTRYEGKIGIFYFFLHLLDYKSFQE